MVKFAAISKNDTRELREELGLPITKLLRYMRRTNEGFEVIGVKDYVVVDTYQPSGVQSLRVVLDTREEIQIMAPYFAHMQKPSFVEDMINGKEA